MASKAMRARLAANLNTVLGDDGDGDGAGVKGGSEDVSGLGGADESTDTSHITETAVTDGAPAAPPPAEKAPPAKAAPETEAPEQAEAKAKAARAALLEEKLAHAREKRQAQRLAERAKADRQAAAAEREAAAAERSKYDGLRTGSFKDTLQALGRDPMKTFEEMQREAIEASTPEAAARREREASERALEERFKPILSELEQLRAERAQWAAQSHATAIRSSFQQAAADPAFADLRVEYDDETLLEHAQFYDKNPDQFRAAAHQHGVRLTDPAKGFTMHELLQMLSAAQAAHNAGVQARRAAQRPPAPQAGTPTVNGTAPRRNAAVNGTDSANGRAPAGTEDSSLSPRERMRLRAREEIRRS
jgi:hypothetical protein